MATFDLGTAEIKPDEHFGGFQRRIQQSLDLAAFSLRSQPSGEGSNRYLDVPMPWYFSARTPHDEVESAHANWIKGHLLSDLIEALEPLVDGVFKCAVFSEAKPPFTSEMEAAAFLKRFNSPPAAGKPIGNKLSEMRASFPGILPQDLFDAVDPLRRLRNCLTHASGVVRQRDCDSTGVLRVDGFMWELLFTPDNGEDDIVVGPGFVALSPGTLGARRRSAPVIWAVDQKITVSEVDLQCIAGTLYTFAIALRSNLYDLLRASGKLPPEFIPKAATFRFEGAFELTPAGGSSSIGGVER